MSSIEEKPLWEIQGELHVEVIRPMLRFGLAIQIYVRTDSSVWHAHPTEDGELIATKMEPYTYPERPTLYIDERMADRLFEALERERQFFGGPRPPKENDQIVQHLLDERGFAHQELSKALERGHQLALNLGGMLAANILGEDAPAGKKTQ